MPIRRRSQFANRMTKMKGLEVSEKMMFVRVGELIDTAVNNRTATGSGSDGTVVGRQKRKKNKLVPQPIGLTAEVGTRGAILRWTKVDSSALLNYRIRVTPLRGTSGVEFVATCFSNEFSFKGQGGEYKFEVQSIGRSGEASEWSASEEFEIAETPIILEGNKFDIEEYGVQVSEAVLTPLNYTVFVFASLVLNSFSDPNNNPAVTLELRSGDEYDQSAFIEEFTMYPESEDLNNFDETATPVFRPSSSPGRTGTFNTTQSAMFTPYRIEEDNALAGQQTRFWVTVTGHNEDVVGLSIAIWVGSEALTAGEIQGVDTLQHGKCLELPRPTGTKQGLGTASGNGTGLTTELNDLTIPYWHLNHIWTISFWIKPLDISTSFDIFSRYTVIGANHRPGFQDGVLFNWNGTTQRLTATIRNNIFPGSAGQCVWLGPKVWPLGINNWHHITWTFNGGAASPGRCKLFVNGALQTSFSDTLGSVDFSFVPDFIDQTLHSIGMSPIFGTDDSSFDNIWDTTNLMSARIHSGGIWNVVLSAPAIVSLYNDGLGAFKDWRNSFGNYAQQSDLLHYWRFGALDSTITGPARIDLLPTVIHSYRGVDPVIIQTIAIETQEPLDYNWERDVSFDVGSHTTTSDLGDLTSHGIHWTNAVTQDFVADNPTDPIIDPHLTRMLEDEEERVNQEQIVIDYPGLE